MSEDIALVVRRCDYRGDHAVDYNEVIRVPLTATVADLLKIAADRSNYCKAVVEVKPEGKS